MQIIQIKNCLSFLCPSSAFRAFKRKTGTGEKELKKSLRGNVYFVRHNVLSSKTLSLILLLAFMNIWVSWNSPRCRFNLYFLLLIPISWRYLPPSCPPSALLSCTASLCTVSTFLLFTWCTKLLSSVYSFYECPMKQWIYNKFHIRMKWK